MVSYTIIWTQLLAIIMASMLLNPTVAAPMDINEEAAMLGIGETRKAMVRAGETAMNADAWADLDSVMLRRLLMKYDSEDSNGKKRSFQNDNDNATPAERQKRTPTDSKKCDDKENNESMNARKIIAKNRYLKTSTTRAPRKTCYPIGRFIRPCYNN